MINEVHPELTGRWVTHPEDIAALETYGQVSLVFGLDGSLRYIISHETNDEIVILNYRVENGVIITNQPSAPREERTPFTLTSEGELVLQYGEVESRYIRDTTSDKFRL